jgi:chemotaxis protein MotB
VARKKKPPEHINHERWLVSYADFITLLFAFFTTLYAISTVDAKKAGKLVFAMRAAFNVDFFSTDKPILGLVPPDKPIVDADLERQAAHIQDLLPRRPKKGGEGDGDRGRATFEAVAAALERAVSGDRIGRHVKLRREPRGLVIALEEAGFFPPGSARLRADALALLARLGGLLRDLGHPVRVEGHADDQGADHANWDLSVARAVSVVRHWAIQAAFPPARLSATGYGSHRPLDRSGTEEGRQRNRRVDVVILSSEAAREEPP